MLLQNSTLNRSEFTASPQTALASQRVNARGSISFKFANNETHLENLHQSGSARIKLPNTFADHQEAVLINTAGGLTGGDRLNWDIELNENTNAVITTQASERIYRSMGPDANLATSVRVGRNAHLNWLPQETILFNHSRLTRTFTINLEDDASVFAVEMVVFGRTAMGETITNTRFKDSWRIYQNGDLLHAEEQLFNEEIADIVAKPYALDGNAALATLFYIGPQDLAFLVTQLRSLASHNKALKFGISQFNGKIICRILAKDSYDMRQHLLPMVQIFRKNAPMPAVWKS